MGRVFPFRVSHRDDGFHLELGGKPEKSGEVIPGGLVFVVRPQPDLDPAGPEAQGFRGQPYIDGSDGGIFHPDIGPGGHAD